MKSPIVAAGLAALLCCGAASAHADGASPTCEFAYEIAAGAEAAKADNVRFMNFSGDVSRKIIDTINAMPPWDVTYEAERFMVVIHDDEGFVAAAFVHNGGVRTAVHIPISAWRDLQNLAFGAEA
jgi:hypothetical protein